MRWNRVVAWGLAAMLAAAFLTIAGVRRLNFDESLALRAGGLELDHARAEPAFVMPATLALGELGRWVPDPGALFLVLRLTVAAVVLALMVAAFVALGLGGSRLAVAVALTLCQASFVSHGLEFRYDAALLAALLLLAISLGGSECTRPWLAGAALTILALHHLKGVFLAGVLGAWIAVRLRRRPATLARVAASALATLGCWLALLGALGLGSRWLETLRQFWSLAGHVTRVSFSEALGATMVASLAWWTVALFALVLAARERWRSERRERRDDVALVLAAAGIAVVVVHPHPWAYMLALPAPFLAVIVARRLPSARDLPRVLAWVVVGVALLGLQSVASQRPPWDPWTRSFAAPRAPEVATLRQLRARSLPTDRVLDPSGLVYFLPPCTRDWYSDTLFAERAAAGAWMQGLATGVPAACTCALNTYRLGALPAAARDDLRRDFVPLPSGLALRRGDPRLTTFTAPGAGRSGRIESFW
jgi:hypothetical protein